LRKSIPLIYNETLGDLEINSLSDIKKLPIINKDIMMNHFDRLNTVGLKKDEVMAVAVEKELNKDYLGYYKDEFVIGLSSGTSGNKGLYITPKALTERLPFVFLARSGIPYAICPLRSSLCFACFHRVSTILILHSFLLTISVL
jgi:hypothetical protein